MLGKDVHFCSPRLFVRLRLRLFVWTPEPLMYPSGSLLGSGWLRAAGVPRRRSATWASSKSHRRCCTWPAGLSLPRCPTNAAPSSAQRLHAAQPEHRKATGHCTRTWESSLSECRSWQPTRATSWSRLGLARGSGHICGNVPLNATSPLCSGIPI